MSLAPFSSEELDSFFEVIKVLLGHFSIQLPLFDNSKNNLFDELFIKFDLQERQFIFMSSHPELHVSHFS